LPLSHSAIAAERTIRKREWSKNVSDSADQVRTTEPEELAPRKSYHEPQLSRWAHYEGPLSKLPEEEVRKLLVEVLHYFAVDADSMPLPPKGLPGVLHEKYSWHEPAWDLILTGWTYFLAVARNESRAMHNRWKSAREMVRRIGEEAREELLGEILERERASREDQDQRRAAKPQLVYFIAAESGPIKIGMAASPEQRCRELQTSHHEKLSVLVTCAGGSELERAYHRRFAAHRLNGEWFDRHPDILAEIERLNRIPA
jgi:hypothetical protein